MGGASFCALGGNRGQEQGHRGAKGGSGGVTPGKILRIADGCRCILEHSGAIKVVLNSGCFVPVKIDFQCNLRQKMFTFC